MVLQTQVNQKERRPNKLLEPTGTATITAAAMRDSLRWNRWHRPLSSVGRYPRTKVVWMKSTLLKHHAAVCLCFFFVLIGCGSKTEAPLPKPNVEHQLTPIVVAPPKMTPTPKPLPCFADLPSGSEQFVEALLALPMFESDLAAIREWSETLLQSQTTEQTVLLLEQLMTVSCPFQMSRGDWYPYRKYSALALLIIDGDSPKRILELVDSVTIVCSSSPNCVDWGGEDGPGLVFAAFELSGNLDLLTWLFRAGTGDGAVYPAVISSYRSGISDYSIQFLEALKPLPTEKKTSILQEALMPDMEPYPPSFYKPLSTTFAQAAEDPQHPVHDEASIALGLIREALASHHTSS